MLALSLSDKFCCFGIFVFVSVFNFFVFVFNRFLFSRFSSFSFSFSLTKITLGGPRFSQQQQSLGGQRQWWTVGLLVRVATRAWLNGVISSGTRWSAADVLSVSIAARLLRLRQLYRTDEVLSARPPGTGGRVGPPGRHPSLPPCDSNEQSQPA